MKSRKILLSIAGLLIFVALLIYGSHRTHFRWDILGQQMHFVRWSNILFGVLLIYGAFLVRAFRWTVFLRPTKRLPPLYLLGTQVIGFTAVALFGRLGEIAAEYLRKGSQVFIEGKLRTRKWQDKQGNDRFTTEIIADNMQMLGGRGGGGGGGVSGGSMGGAERSAPPREEFDQSPPPAGGKEDFDDDIPF